jgi:multiple sugar transport system permease protein
VAGAVGGLVGEGDVARASPSERAGRREIDWAGYVFVAFFTVPFLLFNVLPVLFGIYVSLTEWNIVGEPHFIGLTNFREALQDQWLHLAFANVLLYAVVIVPGVVVAGLTFAVFVNQGWPLSGLARTILFTPNVVSATVIGLVWVWILDTQYGLLNAYLDVFGISPVPWLTSTRWSLVGVSIASIWWDLGLAFVLFLAALQDVPKELYDAAALDGAGRWRQFWHVTLPHLRPTLSMVVTLQLISTMRIFSQVYVMTNGGPAGSSSSVIYHIYQTAIVRNMLGYASAVSVLLFAAILALTLVQRLLLRETVRG